MDTLALVLVYTISVFGLCWGLGGSPLTLPLRSRWAILAGVVPDQRSPLELKPQRFLRFTLHLVECPACLGFWVGLALALLVPDIASQLPLPPGTELFRAIALAFFTAGANYLLGRATGLIHEA